MKAGYPKSFEEVIYEANSRPVEESHYLREATLSPPRTLNLGCGLKHLPKAVNLDQYPGVNPDVVHNLNETPWPFVDGSVFRSVGV
jgi:hypothetical protein